MRWHVAAVVTAMMSGPAVAAGCAEYSVDQFLAPVTFFTESMSPVALGEDGALSFQHRDDPGIRATFSLREIPTVEDMTRSEYLAAISDNLAERSRGIRDAGAEAQSAVHPYDPISSMIRMTTPDSRIVGETDMRLSATCHLRVDWNASESGLLASRSLAFIAAIDAVRTLATPIVDRSGFIGEDTAPVGVVPIITGFLAPLLVAFLLTLPRIGSSRSRQAPNLTRFLLAGAAMAGSGMLAACWQTYLAATIDLKHVDSLLLLFALIVAAAAAVASRHRYACLYAASLAITTGTSLAVSGYFDWLPDRNIGLLTAAVIAICGGFAFFVWQVSPTARSSRRSVA